MVSRVLWILAILLLASSGTALAFTLHAETSSSVVISPGYTFVMPDSPASLSFASNVAVSGFYIGRTNLTLGSLGVMVSQAPSSSPSIPMAVLFFDPSASSGDAFSWVSDVAIGTTVLFSFSGLSAIDYSVIVDNSTLLTTAGPSVGFVWASGGTHYFEVSVFAVAPTLDANAMVFILFLLLLFGLGLAGFALEVPVLTILGGVCGFIFGWWLFTQVDNVPIALFIWGLSSIFMLVGGLMALQEAT